MDILGFNEVQKKMSRLYLRPSVFFCNAMSINLLFRSQYTSESNFNSISSSGEIIDANVGSLERWDFTCDLVIFFEMP